MSAVIYLVAAYLLGAIPFGVVIAQARGVDITTAGSGNIGATNVGRVLGRTWGWVVFVLDFLKGALPPALAGWLPTEVAGPGVAIAAGVAAFAGHLFPIYLRFKGGKGVATGAGAVVVLLPVPAALAIGVWLAVVSVSRYVSLASMVAAGALVGTQLLLPVPWSAERWPFTLFALLAAVVVIGKHRGNIQRLRAGTENQLAESPLLARLARLLHVGSLGLWAGAAVFFNALVAPTFFPNFAAVAQQPAGPRTANLAINTGLDAEQQKKLGRALAGTAVAPLFPRLFAWQTVCGLLALITAFGLGSRRRQLLIALAFLSVLVGWPLAEQVSVWRHDMYAADATVASAAHAAFGPGHGISLLLSWITASLSAWAFALAASAGVPPAQVLAVRDDPSQSAASG
jgi:acyl-phosphate glycerol 3-phosphate acyltransferase